MIAVLVRHVINYGFTATFLSEMKNIITT